MLIIIKASTSSLAYFVQATDGRGIINVNLLKLQNIFSETVFIWFRGIFNVKPSSIISKYSKKRTLVLEMDKKVQLICFDNIKMMKFWQCDTTLKAENVI